MRKHYQKKILPVMASLLFATPSFSQQIFDIDSSFGQNGRLELRTALGNTTLYDVQKQPDSKIVSAGYIKNLTDDLLFFRRNADGTADNSFGNNGQLSWDLTGDEGVNAIALQTDGKIVSCGWQTKNNAYLSIITRIDANGVADNNFGTNGVVSFTGVSGSNGSVLRNVKIQPDGKIIVIGTGYLNTGHKCIVQRYNTNGTLDATFGTNGTVTLQFATGSHNYGEDIEIQPDGKIAVIGSSIITNYATRVARLDANGVLDATFGTNGIFTPSISGFSDILPTWITVLPDGRLQTVGYAYNSSQSKVISFRMLANGQLDANFGTNGVTQFAATTDNNFAWDAHLYPNNELAMAVEYYNGNIGSAAILKIDSSGNAVPSYGSNGFATFPTASTGFSSALTNDGDSLILVGGMKDNTAFNYEGFVLKADPNGNNVNSFGLITTAAGASSSTGTRLLRLPSGNIILIGTNNNNDEDIVMVKMDVNGNMINSFGTNGVKNLNTSNNETVKDVVMLANGNIAVVSETGSVTLSFPSLGNFTGNEHYTFTILDTNGNVVSGPHNSTYDATEFPHVNNFAVDGNGNYLLVGRSSEAVFYKILVARHSSNFSYDNSFGSNGIIDITTGSNGNTVTIGNIVASPDNKAVFVFNGKQIWKLNDDASGDASFGTLGNYTVSDTVGGGLAKLHILKGVSHYYLPYIKSGTAKIIALDFNGQLSTAFSGVSLGQADEMRVIELSDMSLMVALRNGSVFTIKHVLSNGTIDNNFNNNTSEITFTPFTNDQLFTDLTVTSDTSFYFFHQFRNNGELTHVGISKVASKQQPTQPTNIININKNDVTVSVYPNPIQNKFSVAFSGKNINAQKFVYQLIDVTGKTIPINSRTASSENVDIETHHNLPPGNYILSVSDMKEHYFSIPLIKQ